MSTNDNDKANQTGQSNAMLLFLYSQPDYRIIITELPEKLSKRYILKLCDKDKLIEFGNKEITPEFSDMEVPHKEIWNFNHVTGRGFKPMDQILKEAHNYVGDPQYNMHIQLTDKGRERAEDIEDQKANKTDNEKSTKSNKNNITDKPHWETAQVKLLVMVANNEQYTSLADMRDRTGCGSTDTITRAIKKSVILQEWQNTHLRNKGIPSSSSITDKQQESFVSTRESDPSKSIEADDDDIIFQNLLEDAKETERAILHTKTPAERKRLCEAIRNDPDKYNKILNRRP